MRAGIAQKIVQLACACRVPDQQICAFSDLCAFPKPLVSVIIAVIRYLLYCPLEPRIPLDQQLAVQIELSDSVDC